jgi:hypothetical protein
MVGSPGRYTREFSDSSFREDNDGEVDVDVDIDPQPSRWGGFKRSLLSAFTAGKGAEEGQVSTIMPDQ